MPNCWRPPASTGQVSGGCSAPSSSPSIMPAVLVVLTTEIIAALKVFDIVYVLTNGNYNTDVIANRMYNELFAVDDLGHASAIAVILLVAAMPVVLLNVVQFRAEAQS